MLTELLDTQITSVVLSRLTPFLDWPLAVYRLPAFLDTIQNPNLRTAVVPFSPRSVAVVYYPEQPQLPQLLPCLILSFVCKRPCSNFRRTDLRFHLASSDLMTDYRHRCSWEFSQVQSWPWHALLRSFGGVRTLKGAF